ncbi:MAG: response regulator [Chlamydiota bacterium]
MKKKILVIDDEEDIVKMLAIRLTHAGYEIQTAFNGKEGFDILCKDPSFDLILLDLIMPVMDGYEFAHLVQKDPNLRTIPIILLSASTDHLEEKRQSLHAKAKIMKPFDPVVLLDTIKSLINEKEGPTK